MPREPLVPTIGYLRVAGFIVLALGALTLHRVLTEPASEAQHSAVGMVVPEVTLTLLKEPPFREGVPSGPLLVDFWALDCVPCRRVRPGLTRVADQLADLNVIPLSVNIDPPVTSTDRLAHYLDTTAFRGVVVRDTGTLQRALSIRSTPTVLLTDADRRVLAVWSGRVDPATMERQARRLLQSEP